MLFFLEHVGKLAAERGLTGTLQTRHQDNSRLARKMKLRSLATHELCQLVVDDFHHELTRLDGSKHIHAKCLVLYSISKLFCDLVVDISVEKRATNVFQCGRDIELGYFSLTLKYLERAFKAIG